MWDEPIKWDTPPAIYQTTGTVDAVISAAGLARFNPLVIIERKAHDAQATQSWSRRLLDCAVQTWKIQVTRATGESLLAEQQH